MKNLKRAAAGVMVFVLMLVSAFAMPKAARAEGSIDLYFQNTESWESVYVYIWQGSGPVKGTASWPGAEMTPAEGTEDWYHVEYTAGTPFQVIFNNNGIPSAQQTGNLPADLEADAEAYWFVIDGATTEEGTSDGITPSGLQVTVLTEAPEGFPAAEAVPDEAVTETAEAAGDVPKTGDNTAAVIGILAAAMFGTAAVILRKKEVRTDH